MSKNSSRPAPASSGDQWEQRFEAALLERDPAMLACRLQNAKDAILHRIKESCKTAPISECRLLIAALHTITELQRGPEMDDLWRPLPPQTLGHAA
jgi:hypothetical protein